MNHINIIMLFFFIHQFPPVGDSAGDCSADSVPTTGLSGGGILKGEKTLELRV